MKTKFNVLECVALHKRNNIQKYVITMPLTALPTNFPSEHVNPRKQNLKSPICTEIEKCIQDPQLDNFENDSIGMHIAAHSLTYTKGVRPTVELEFKEENEGVINGMHLYGTILNTLLTLVKEGTLAALPAKYITLFVMIGATHAQIMHMIRTVNRSAIVSDVTLADAYRQFDTLKYNFRSHPGWPFIGYQQNDKKPHKVMELVTLLVATKPKEKEKPSSSMPYYSQKGAFNTYISGLAMYDAFSVLMPDIAKLSDYICTSIKPQLTKMGVPARSYQGMTSEKKSARYAYPFDPRLMQSEDTTPVSRAVLLPFVGAFVCMFKQEVNGVFSWKNKTGVRGAKKVFDTSAEDLLKFALACNKHEDYKQTELGKSTAFWEGCYTRIKHNFVHLYNNKEI